MRAGLACRQGPISVGRPQLLMLGSLATTKSGVSKGRRWGVSRVNPAVSVKKVMGG